MRDKSILYSIVNYSATISIDRSDHKVVVVTNSRSVMKQTWLRILSVRSIKKLLYLCQLRHERCKYIVI